MSNHRYILEPYKGMKTRSQCPSCQHREKSFALYVDTVTGEYLNVKVGRCNRESNCGYHYSPRQYFQDHNIGREKSDPAEYRHIRPVKLRVEPKPVSFIQDSIFRASLNGYDHNHFISFLISRFGGDIATRATKRYLIGSSKHWEGSTVFWQIDIEGRVRTGKIILYNPVTGKRVKEPRICINWVHSVLKAPGFSLKQVLFGEHLLKDNAKPCALVESEKSAVIASLYFPEYIWLATGSLTNLSEDICRVLKGQKVILFPDLKGYDKWKIKASEIKNLTDYSISDLLEQKATESEKLDGLDIADYLLKYDLHDFRLNTEVKTKLNTSSHATEQDTVEIPFENTQLYENLMFDFIVKYFKHPLLDHLLKEKPFSSNWNRLYLHIRKIK